MKIQELAKSVARLDTVLDQSEVADAVRDAVERVLNEVIQVATEEVSKARKTAAGNASALLKSKAEAEALRLPKGTRVIAPSGARGIIGPDGMVKVAVRPTGSKSRQASDRGRVVGALKANTDALAKAAASQSKLNLARKVLGRGV